MATGDKLVTYDMAKAVYDTLDGEVADLKTAISNKSFYELAKKTHSTTVGWENGAISSATGDNANWNKAIRTTDYFIQTNIEKVATKTGFVLKAFKYSSTGEYIETYDYMTEFTLPVDSEYKYRFVLTSDDQTVTMSVASHAENFVFHLNANKNAHNEYDTLSKFVQATHGRQLTNLIDTEFRLAGAGYGVEYANGNTSRINGFAASDFIEVEPETLYYVSYSFSSSKYGTAFYDATKTFISGYGGNQNTEVPIYYAPENAKYMRCTFAQSQTENVRVYKVTNRFPYSENVIPYYGEKISLTNAVKYRKIYGVAKATYGEAQGGTVFGDMLFAFANNLAHAWALNLKTKEIKPMTYTGPDVDNHANVVSIGNTRYDANDPYPVVYISSEREAFCGVYRIIEDAGALSFSEVSRINFQLDESGYVYGNACVDCEQGYIYVRWQDYLYKYDLPASVNSDVSLSGEAYDSTTNPNGYLKRVPFVPVYNKTGTTDSERRFIQDQFIHNGRLYMAMGGRTSAALDVIDLHTGSVLSFASLMSMTPYEPEILTRYGDTILIYETTGGLYQLDFE